MYPIAEPCGPGKMRSCLVTMSMGNNPLKIRENMKDVLTVLNTRHDDVVLLVCDEINKYEQTISHGVSDTRAEKLAMEAGNQLVLHLQSVVQEWESLNPQSLCSIRIFRWVDIKDASYEKVFQTIVRFRDRFDKQLQESSTYYIQSRLQMVTLTERRLENFSQYTLEELPVQLFGVGIDGKQCSVLYHPVYCRATSLMSASSGPIYHSPIENVTKAYRDDPEFMVEARKDAPGHLDAQLIRIFFGKVN